MEIIDFMRWKGFTRKNWPEKGCKIIVIGGRLFVTYDFNSRMFENTSLFTSHKLKKPRNFEKFGKQNVCFSSFKYKRQLIYALK
uniref:Uncharacterized protein n=1 Tax=Onchocerca volvulus TaxID=6282 RepID=A0A8R1TLE8_ONCVO